MSTSEDHVFQSKLAHLQMIQEVIGRMASDVQTLKTLAITVSAGVVALSQTQSSNTSVLIWVSILPVVIFWGLTAYSLHIERAYRHLYDLVRLGEAVETFSMEWRPYKKSVASWWCLLFSPTVFLLYLAAISVLILAALSVQETPYLSAAVEVATYGQ